jgi:hypothetical protein
MPSTDRAAASGAPAPLRAEAAAANEARVFGTIWAAIFLASVSTFFLLMTLSAMIFADTRSALAANAVVLTQWLPAVLALGAIRAVGARHPARTLLIAAEVASAALLPAVALLYGTIYPLLALLLVKGGLDALSKVARPVALKGYFAGERLDRAAAYYNIAALAGSGVGALCGALVLDRLGLAGVLAACVGLHLGAAALYGSLPRAKGTAARGRRPPIPFSALDGRVRAAFVYFVAAVCLFQGYHNVARSVFPTLQLGMSEAGIALIQTVTSFAYIAGAVLAARISVSGGRYDTVGPLFHGLALLSLGPLTLVAAQVPGIAVYALFAFAFEIAFCVHLRQLIVGCPADHLPHLMASANAWAMGSMVVLSLVGSYAVESVGLQAVTLAVGACALFVFPVARAGLGRRGDRIPENVE